MKNWLRRWLGVAEPPALYVIRTAELRPDDVLLVHSERLLGIEACESIRKQLDRQFPGRKVVVLSEGLKLGILSPRAA